MEGWGLAF